MLNKNAVKTCFGVLSLSFLVSFPAGAWWPFADSAVQENTNSVGSKETFEDSKDKLESTKSNYKELIAQINDIVSQFETSLSDFKDSRVSFEEQMIKLDAAHKEWEEHDYALKGDSFEKFSNEKEQFDKVACMVRIKEDILKTLFDNLSDFIQKDSDMYNDYKTCMSNSIDAYYSYGMAVAKGVSSAV